MKMPFIPLAAIVLLNLPLASQAHPRTEELRRCLADFGGIAWKLPYLPPLTVRSCAGPSATYDAGDKTPPSRRVLELIGELTLGAEPQLSSDENYAALQQAMLAHFDALFRRHGFHQVWTETGNARVYPHPGPAIPYVSKASYVRNVEGREQTLVFAADMKNTWRITLDGLAEERK